ncbi:hypothetical protein HPB48_005214 [Haemaphysalis longicornis]|uniref:Uncharacterized protein n=1 Tax=Haemaphysalis longicornis TaxID=44386 RepID=A0A9J6FH01_HAELO|nr:hypothetical protein HPB48_005214 [Haemaphysalis longicornis]
MLFPNSDLLGEFEQNNDIFVQDRVNEIKRKSRANQWGYAKSDENPADVMTREIKNETAYFR